MSVKLMQNLKKIIIDLKSFNVSVYKTNIEKDICVELNVLHHKCYPCRLYECEDWVLGEGVVMVIE